MNYGCSDEPFLFLKKNAKFAFFLAPEISGYTVLWTRVRDIYMVCLVFLFSTSGLDSTTTEIVMAVLKTLSRKNITM